MHAYSDLSWCGLHGNGLRSEGPGFILKADISKLFLLCCVFSEIVTVSEIPEGRAGFYQVTESNFLSFIKYCLKIINFIFFFPKFGYAYHLLFTMTLSGLPG